MGKLRFPALPKTPRIWGQAFSTENTDTHAHTSVYKVLLKGLKFSLIYADHCPAKGTQFQSLVRPEVDRLLWPPLWAVGGARALVTGGFVCVDSRHSWLFGERIFSQLIQMGGPIMADSSSVNYLV